MGLGARKLACSARRRARFSFKSGLVTYLSLNKIKIPELVAGLLNQIGLIPNTERKQILVVCTI